MKTNQIAICLLSGLLLTYACGIDKDPATIELDAPVLMHEMRATPHPLDGCVLRINPPRFMWPDYEVHRGPALDGVAVKHEKKAATYRIRIARDINFTQEVITAERKWAFFNPYKVFAPGTWYWQHAFVTSEGEELWSDVYRFEVTDEATLFNPPAFEQVARTMPKGHPRVVLAADEWDEIIERNKTNPDAQTYIAQAKQFMQVPVAHLSQQIDTTHLHKLTNEVQYKSSLIRESRKIVDREEHYIETLVKAYALTQDPRYALHAMDRLKEMISWRKSHLFAGDFNQSALLQTATQAYDLFYTVISPEDRALLLHTIGQLAGRSYAQYVNHLENHIADNHVWQMTLRILTMAAFATIDEIPEARLWADYCYNIWVARFPGLNDDGAWHNGDSYFHVNMRTLVEVPAFYTRISGFDFFSDPWFNKNADYAIYHQPAFSKSAGHGNSHENRTHPLGERIAYVDVLARACQNPYAAQYVRQIEAQDPDAIRRYREPKCGDVTWYRLTHDLSLPDSTVALNDRSLTRVFPNTGVATMHTNLDLTTENAMLSFRSSPYGSTSHAHANQNAFNTFYGGKAIFYSSGHRTGFTDKHCMYSYRNTRAHNTLLVDGKGQKIGTEGYGWIPRYYEGNEISYVLGDASNAYGPVTSELWLERAALSDVSYSAENGWGPSELTKYRRHMVQLGLSGIVVVYDELQAKAPVTFTYQLHTRECPMQVDATTSSVQVKGTNGVGGQSVAYLQASTSMQVDTTDQFFFPAENWLRKTDAQGNVISYPNHYHFRATTQPAKSARFVNIMQTLSDAQQAFEVQSVGPSQWVVGTWSITAVLDADLPARLVVEDKTSGVKLSYDLSADGGKTHVLDQTAQGLTHIALSDILPYTEQ